MEKSRKFQGNEEQNEKKEYLYRRGKQAKKDGGIERYLNVLQW